jgi:hypothetical protein
MVALKKETGLKETNMKSQDSVNTRGRDDRKGSQTIRKQRPGLPAAGLGGYAHQNHSHRLMEKGTKALIPSFHHSNIPNLEVCQGFKSFRREKK